MAKYQYSLEDLVRKYEASEAASRPSVMHVNDIDILIDDKPKNGLQPVIGLQINPHTGTSFIIPLTYGKAKEMAYTILQTLMFAAPEILFNE